MNGFRRNVGSLVAANAAVALLTLLQGVFAARVLGPEAWGVAVLVMAFPSVLYTFFDARSSDASIKYLSEARAAGEHARALAVARLGYLVDLAMAAAAFLCVLAGARWNADSIVHRPEAFALSIAFAASFLPKALFGTSIAILSALGRFATVGAVNVFEAGLRAALVVGLLLAGHGVAGLVAANVVATLATGIAWAAAANAAFRKASGASPFAGRLRDLGPIRGEIFRFLAYSDLSVLVVMISKQLDVLVLGYFRGASEVGFYKLAKSLASASGYLLQPLQSVVYPELVRLGGDAVAVTRRLRRLGAAVGLPLGIAASGAAVLAPLLLPIVAGEAYAPAAPALRLLLVGSAVSLAFFWVRPLFLARGAVRDWLVVNTLVAALSVVAFFLLAPRAGMIGLAAWGAAVPALAHSLAFLARRRHRSVCNPAFEGPPDSHGRQNPSHGRDPKPSKTSANAARASGVTLARESGAALP